MLPEIDDYDWNETFKYAASPDPCPPESKMKCEGFTQEDVTEILCRVLGENDGAAWELVGKLRDGRFFYLNASCDYTGWG